MKILYFAPCYFDDIRQRPQQLAVQLAQYHDIYYIEPTVSWMRQIWKGGRSCFGVRYLAGRQLKIIRLNGLFTFHKSMEYFDITGLNNMAEILQLKKIINHADLIWVGYAGWYTVIRHFKGLPLVWDRMDDDVLLSNTSILRRTLRKNQEAMFQKANLIFTSSEKFYMEQVKIPSFLIPNGLAEEFVNHTESDRNNQRPASGKLIFGYVGTIGSWFDFKVLDKILDSCPKAHIMIIGKNQMPVYQHERVEYAGIKKLEELPGQISKFDVCLYNFKKSELLDTINPVKLYEYLAMNKPILAVRSQETEHFKDYLMLYDNLDEIPGILKKSFKIPFSTWEERTLFIRENTWKSRACKINEILHSHMFNTGEKIW